MTDELKKAEAVADEAMIKNAVGEDYDALAEPPFTEAAENHKLWPLVKATIKEIYDPEIPVNIYELGLIYIVDFDDKKDADGNDKSDVIIKMTLTSPGCPVAQEMPIWIQNAILPLEGVGDVDVEVVWDPMWTPNNMAETAKMQLNMFT